ncbi:PTS mannose transporter subunit IIAB [Aerococcaceae bacterium DSM 111021]|nr:PTS mannose transporter subunit IIAB [Aerococcaceae bacterium DSM 111021]
MVSIILASHGEFAEGLLQSAQMIFGEQEQITTVTFMPEEGPDDLKAKLESAVASYDADAEILFLVDLWGGSPFNQANILFEKMSDRAAIVSGMNLPMLLEALGTRMGMDKAHDVASHILGKEQSGIRVRPEELVPEPEASVVSEATGSAQLDPGTVIGDGKIKYVLTRIDTRLLHGQVATGWVKSVNPTRIIVVSDKVANDEMRKTLIKQAAPPGVRANVIPIAKLAEINEDPRFGGTRALLLFETPQDVLEAIKLGVELDEVNLGSMAHSKGKVMINNSVSVDDDDVKTLMALKDKGVKFDVRKVPADSAQNLDRLLKKEKLI